MVAEPVAPRWWESRTHFERLLARCHWPHIGFMAAWEAQSQLATIAFVALAGLAPIWAAFLVMLSWALIGTVVYHRAREQGVPDLLEYREGRPDEPLTDRLFGHLGSAFRAWLAGLQPTLFARTACRFLDQRRYGWWGRLGQAVVLGLGLTLFGVTTCNHVFRRAGLRQQRLLRACLLGPFFNVSYRLFLSAALWHAVERVVPDPNLSLPL